MLGMLIVFKPIMLEDFTRQNHKLNKRYLVGFNRNQKNRKGQILLKMMLQGKKGHFLG